MFFARVDLPMPGRPTGTKKSFLTDRMSSVAVRSIINYRRAFWISSGLQPNGTATSWRVELGGEFSTFIGSVSGAA